MRKITEKLLLLFLLMTAALGANAQNRFWIGGASSGELTDGTKWSATLGGSAIGGTLTVTVGQYYIIDGTDLNGTTSGPGTGPVTIALTGARNPGQFIIRNGNVTVNLTSTSTNNLNIGSAASTASVTGDDFVVGSGCTLNLNANAYLTLNSTSNAARHTANIAGTVNLASSANLVINQGFNVFPDATNKHIISGTVNVNNTSALFNFANTTTTSRVNLDITGTVNIIGASARMNFQGTSTNSRVYVGSTGRINIGGTVTTLGYLTWGGSTTYTSPVGGFVVDGIINYNATTAQTLLTTMVLNSGGQLILDGSGAKTFAIGQDLSGLVSFQGQATFPTSGSAPDFLNAGTLEFKGSLAQTINTAIYSSTNSSAPAILIIDNSQPVTLSSSRFVSNKFILKSGTFTHSGGTLTVGDSVRIASGGTYASSGGGFSVGGHFLNNGTMTQSGALNVSTFTGVNKNISGSGTINFGAIAVASGAVTNLLKDINLHTNQTSTITGTLDAATFVISEAGSATTANITLASGSLFRTSNTNGFRNATGASINPNMTINSLNANSTVEFYGGNQPVYGDNTSASYGHVIISGTGTKTATNNTVDLAGDFTINTGATYDASTNNYQLTVGGQYTNNGTFVARNGVVEFNGSGVTQNIFAGTGDFYDVKFSNAQSSSPGHVLTSNATVTNSTIWANGRVDVGNFNFTYGPSAVLAGNSNTNLRMFVSSGTGELRKVFPTGASSFTFPIGELTTQTSGEYTPVNLDFTANSTQRTIGLKVADAQHPQDGSSVSYLSRYWSFSATPNTGTYTYNSTFNYISSTDLVAPTTGMVASYIYPPATTWSAITGSTVLGTTMVSNGVTQATGSLNGAQVTGRITVVIPTGPIIWQGGTVGNETNWNTGGNWSTGTVPTAADDIQIPNQTYSPVVFTGATATAKDVAISAGATVTVNSGFILDIKGDWAGNNNSTFGAGFIVFSGSSAQAITGGGNFSNLRINNANGVSLTGALAITGGLDLQAGTFATNGNVTIKSNATGTGYINNFSSGYTGTLTGNVTIERYNGTASGFHYLSMPISNPNISEISEVGLIGTDNGQVIPQSDCNTIATDQTSAYGNVMQWSEAGPFLYTGCKQSGWFVRSSGTLETARGYLVKINNGQTLSVNGTPNLGNQSGQSGFVAYATTLNNTNTTGDGWQLMGNPFPSPLVWAGVAGFGDLNLFTTSGQYTGTYQAYAPAQNRVMTSMQGFFVRRLSAGGSVFTLSNSNRVATTTPQYQNQNSWYNHLLEIDVTGNGFADHSTVYFANGATSGYEEYFDARKLDGREGQPQITTHLPNGTEQLGVNGFGNLTEALVVPLTMKPGADGSFTLNFSELATFPQSAMVYLEDKQLGTMVNLRDNSTYTFAALATDNAERFAIHFQPGVQATVVNQNCDALGSIELNQPAPTTWANYVVRGTDNNVYAQGSDFTGVVNITNLPAQEYVVTLTHNSGYTAQEFITVNGQAGLNATVAASADNVQVADLVTFTGTTNGATEYVWNFGDGNVELSQATTNHVYDEAGVYTVTLTATNDICTSVATKTITVTNTATNLNTNKANYLNIYGQGDRVVLEFNNWAAGTKADVFMYNAIGQKVGTLTGASTVTGRQYIAVAGITPGYYLVQVVSNGTVQGRKLFLGNN